ncbi:MAG: agmatine deiminase family protein [Deltaproteobacteria bacterium]|nr:agmatine deiminase family protein [Deltaproteobacteria bacterium]
MGALVFFQNQLYARPFAGYESVQTVVMSADKKIAPIASQILKNLPTEVEMVFLATENFIGDEVVFDHALKDHGADLIPHRFLHIFPITTQMPYWVRDYAPFPLVQSQPVDGNTFDAFGAIYWKGNERQPTDTTKMIQTMSNLTGLRMAALDQLFLYGNLLADRAGRCFLVEEKTVYFNSFGRVDSVELNPTYLTRDFQCTKIVRIPFDYLGVGHVDEVMTLINDHQALTTKKNVKEILEGEGYQVELLPDLNQLGYSYANVLIVNNTVFIPEFGFKQDAEAKQIYSKYFSKVVSIDTSMPAAKGGGLHCVTAAYPQKFN